MRRIDRFRCWTQRAAAVAAALLAPLAVAQTDDPAASVYQPPQKPLDDRIEASKITESEPPPLPHQMILPMPPEFRLAESRDLVPVSDAHWQAARASIQRGVARLRELQHDRGGWMVDDTATPTDQPEKPSPVSVAVTALVVKAIVQAEGDAAIRSPEIQKALAYIRLSQNEDGSFEGGALTNYVTAAVVSGLASLDDPDVQDNIRAGVRWLTTNQWHQAQGLKPEHDWFGGAGYGNHGRPDLSNTQMMLDALYDAEMSPHEPAMQRAIAFVSRAQNLQATNKSEWTGNDGGFIYTPANGGESMASQAAGEGRYGEKIPEGQARSLRSYGSMTYAGFKSLIYAGLSQDDVRVRAAFDWIRRHWTFDENPGLGQQGLYYYYQAMSRALRVAQQPTIVDIDNKAHNWREELIDAVASRQNASGGWRNDAERWLEGEETMATIHAVLALEEALKPAPIEAQR